MLENSVMMENQYIGLLKTYPKLQGLSIKGDAEYAKTRLRFETMAHANLKDLEVITSGLSSLLIDQIAHSDLPKLESLRLCFGLKCQGFDGSIETIKPLLKRNLFPNLKHLGLLNSDIQDEIVFAVLASDILKGLRTLDLSMGNLTDIGGRALLNGVNSLSHLEEITIDYHYLSYDMIYLLEKTRLNIRLLNQQSLNFWMPPKLLDL